MVGSGKFELWNRNSGVKIVYEDLLKIKMSEISLSSKLLNQEIFNIGINK
jgi:hypothetical protein